MENQRLSFNIQFFTRVLLGVPENAINHTPEFIAFSQGIDLYLTPAIPSFTKVKYHILEADCLTDCFSGYK